jgi:ribosome-binding ATPase YchF (GTP1/OBG family)
LIRAKDLLETKVYIKDGNWTPRDMEILNKYLFITAKPIVYLANLSEDDYKTKKNKYLPKIAKWINEHGGGALIPYSADYETKLTHFAGADMEIRAKSAAEEGAPSAITKIIRTGYHTLQLIHFFTAGEDEVKCWTVREGSKAPRGAGTIHTDFEKGFICAEIMKYADFIELGSEMACKNEGKYRQ